MPINIKYQYLSLIKVKSSCSDIRQIIACLTLLPWVHFFLIRQHQKTLLLLYRGHIALRALVAELLLLVVGGCIGFCWPNGWCWKLSSRNGRREMQRKIALASASSSSSYFVLPFSLGFFLLCLPPSIHTILLSLLSKEAKRTWENFLLAAIWPYFYYYPLRIWNRFWKNFLAKSTVVVLHT